MSKAMQLELNALTRLEDLLHLEKNANTVIYFLLML